MNEFVEKDLPLSKGMYKLNIYGEVLNSSNNVLPVIIKAGRKVILLDWVNGYKYYDLAVITAIVSLNIKLPPEDWDKIEIIFSDNNELNTNISNISYRFKNGPLKVSWHEDFYRIPYYTNFVISLEGELYNLRRQDFHLWGVTNPRKKKNITGGYFAARADRDVGISSHSSRHRLISLAFNRYETNPLKLVVNHKNGKPGDDRPENLEWVTYAQNNQHAYDNGLFPNKVRKIIMKDLSTGKETKYPTISKCVSEIGKSHNFITARIYNCPYKRYSDNLAFKLDDGKEWPVLEDKITSTTVTNCIVVRNIFTGDINIFDSAVKPAKMAGTTRTTIITHSETEAVIPINGYNFRFLNNKINWPIHSDKHLKIYKLYPYAKTSGVLIKDMDGNEIEFYESLEIASKKYKKSLNGIKHYCASKKCVDGKIFSYYKLTENLSPTIE